MAWLSCVLLDQHALTSGTEYDYVLPFEAAGRFKDTHHGGVLDSGIMMDKAMVEIWDCWGRVGVVGVPNNKCFHQTEFLQNIGINQARPFSSCARGFNELSA
jgi:hypothetical protein